MTLRRLSVGGVELLVIDIGPIDESELLEGLSEAERAVARLACEGHSDAEIAALRGSSRKTVANQLHRLYRKLGVCSRAELVAKIAGAG